MKIKLPNRDFLTALNNVGKVISPKSIDPILSNVLIRANDTSITFVATNLEQGIKNTVDANVEIELDEPKETVLPFSLLREIISKFNNEEQTEILVSSNKGIIKQETSEYKFNCFNANAFALLPEIEEKIKITIPMKILKKLTVNTIFATSKREESRKEFKGILFDAKDNNLRFVGTDSTCLAFSNFPVEGIEEKSFIIPWKALDILDKVEVKEETIEIISNKNQISFNAPNINIISLLINGSFPPYEIIIPKESDFRAEVRKDELLPALDRVEVLARSSTKKIVLTFSAGNLNIEAVLPEISEGKESVKFEGTAELSLILHGEKLINGITHINDDIVVFEMNSPLHPIKIKGKGDDSYIYIIMPQKKTTTI
jgi:DNA polymerase-3 subunit beta